MAKYQKALDKTESTNRKFRTKSHRMETYEQTKQRLSYFHMKGFVEANGNPTLRLEIQIP